MSGAVRGAVLRPSSGLTVNGAAAGHFEIAEDAVLVVNGAVADLTADNEGVIMVSGVLELPRGALDELGKVVVMPGSVVNQAILDMDGSLREPTARERENLTINGGEDDWCVWSPRSRRSCRWWRFAGGPRTSRRARADHCGSRPHPMASRVSVDRLYCV